MRAVRLLAYMAAIFLDLVLSFVNVEANREYTLRQITQTTPLRGEIAHAHHPSAVTFAQHLIFFGVSEPRRRNKKELISILDVLPASASGNGTAMRDSKELMDFARRYFRDAAVSTDVRRMRLLAELGIEHLRLADDDGATADRASEGTLRRKSAD